MPYYLYSITADKEPELLQAFDGYRQAKQAATAMRVELPAGENRLVRIIFAQDPSEAVELLKTKRERQPSEDD